MESRIRFQQEDLFTEIELQWLIDTISILKDEHKTKLETKLRQLIENTDEMKFLKERSPDLFNHVMDDTMTKKRSELAAQNILIGKILEKLIKYRDIVR